MIQTSCAFLACHLKIEAVHPTAASTKPNTGGVFVWRPFCELERWRREMDRELGRHFGRPFHDIEPVELEESYFPAIESYVKTGAW